MEYTDDGDSESELLDPVQESQRTLDRTSKSDEPPPYIPSVQHETRIQQANFRGMRKYTKYRHVFNKIMAND